MFARRRRAGLSWSWPRHLDQPASIAAGGALPTRLTRVNDGKCAKEAPRSLARSPTDGHNFSLVDLNQPRSCPRAGQGRAGQGGRSRSPGPGGFGSSFDNARLAYMIARLLTFRSGAGTQAWGRELLALTPPYPRWSLIATLPHLPLSLPNIRKTLKEASKNNLKNVHVTMI